MKKLFYLLVFFFLFLFVFLRSDTWEIRKRVEIKRGLEFEVRDHIIHWDRFFSYIKNIPKKILESDILRGLAAK